MANRPRRAAEVPPEPTPPPAPLPTEEVTLPGVPPPETPPEALPPSPEDLEAQAAAERQRAEEEAAARAAAEVAAAGEAERQRLDAEAAAATQTKIDNYKGILRGYFNSVRRSTKKDAVEWLGRMLMVETSIAEAVFDATVSDMKLGKETVDRPVTTMVQVDEFFIPSR